MSLLKKIVAIALTFLALLFVAGLLLPSKVHVEREIAIDAPPEDIFPFVSQLEAWDTWSPWATLDPHAVFEVAGDGLGQTMSWVSEDPRVGKGSQQIVAVKPPTFLKTQLEFDGMGAGSSYFDLVRDGDSTKVVWSMDTDMRANVTFWVKPLSTYLGFLMDTVVGADYERGLQNLKDAVER